MCTMSTGLLQRWCVCVCVCVQVDRKLVVLEGELERAEDRAEASEA